MRVGEGVRSDSRRGVVAGEVCRWRGSVWHKVVRCDEDGKSLMFDVKS